MSREGLPSATRFLVLALSLLYALAAVAGPVLVDFDSTRDVVFWMALAARPERRSCSSVSCSFRPDDSRRCWCRSGPLLGGLPLFWTLLVPVAVAAVIACSIALARRDAAPA